MKADGGASAADGGAPLSDARPVLHRGASANKEGPLVGKRVVVTRARAQASGQIEILRRLGADALAFPTIRIEPVSTSPEIEAMLATLDTYDLVVFTSVNSVDCFFDLLCRAGKGAGALQQTTVVAIGPKTAAACRSREVTPDIVPGTSIAEGVLEALAGRDLSGRRILIPRAREAREVLPESLAAAGAVVDVVVLYDTVPETHSQEEIERVLDADYVTFTSGSTAKNFADLLRSAGFGSELRRVTAASIGPATSKTVREEGMRLVVEAESYTVDGLVEALVEHALYSLGSE